MKSIRNHSAKPNKLSIIRESERSRSIMRKNLLENKGLPLSVNQIKDLPAISGTTMDSWYIITNFECEGEKIAFEWHQQTIQAGPMRVVTAECLLQNASKDICYHEALTQPVSDKNGASETELKVYSDWGIMQGNRDRMEFDLTLPHGKFKAVVTPKKEVLYNGTTGLLHFIGQDSYEFAFPNMDIEGTLTIDGKEYEIKNTTAWFDRQWGFTVSDTDTVGDFGDESKYKCSWIWLGLPLNEHEAISMWDAYQSDGRHAFVTILKENGLQYNLPAEITYTEIWKSEHSGKSYPKKFEVRIPGEEIELTIESYIKDPEFVRNGGKGLCGCQPLCKVTGTYHGTAIERNNIVEMIEDVCGEA